MEHVSPAKDGSPKVDLNNSPGLQKQLRKSIAHNINRPTEAFRSSNKLALIGEVTAEEKKNDETVSYRYDVLILLFFVGLITGVLNGSVLWAIKMISISQSRLLRSNVAGPFLFIFTTTCYCAVSAFIIKKGKLPAASGAGLPEVKALMVNDLKAAEYPKMVSLKILALRVSSLLFAAGSSLSVGVQGPLVHAAVCTSYCMAYYIPDFHKFLDNPNIMKQIFAASAAVGLATVFNAPVGGLLFSVEVTSTYYLISNYWRSFMAATTGAVMYSIFLIDRNQSHRIFDVDYVKDTYHQWELPLFAILGVIVGLLTYTYSVVHHRYFLAARPWQKAHPIVAAALVGALTALLVYLIHAYSNDGVSVAVMVHDCLEDCNVSTMATAGGMYHVSRIGGLLASLSVRTFITMLGTALPISNGPFMPMVLLGSQVGRIFGQIVADLSSPADNIYVAGYAMVGAAAFVSGTTHTISTAVIVVEMTGQINMLLPCLIGAVIACGMNKAYKLSLYDQGMVNKGLESFELLLQTGVGFTQVMDENAVSVTHTCQVADLFLMLENGKQEVFPVVDDLSTNKLIGSINRRDVFLFIKGLFEKECLLSYLRHTLPDDTKVDDAAMRKRFLKVADDKTTQSRFRLLSEAGKHISLGIMELAQFGRSPGKANDTPDAHLEQARRYATETGAAASVSARSSVDVDVEQGGDRCSPGPGPGPGGEGSLARSFSGTSISTLTGTNASWATESGNPLNNSSHKAESAGLSSAAALVVETLLEREVDLAKEPTIPVNIFPFTVQEHTTMDQLYVLFEMVKVECVFVVRDDGTLRGMINKDLLLQNLRRKVH